MKKVIIMAVLAFAACKKETIKPSPVVSAPITSNNHYSYQVSGSVSNGSQSVQGDSLSVEVNNSLVLAMNKQQLAISGASFKYKCYSGDQIRIYENPGKDANGIIKSAGITLYLNDTSMVSPETYSITIGPCNCVIIHNFMTK